MKLILIHGRDQQGKDPDKLKAQWIDTWEKGLMLNKLERPANLDIVFPFYGDLLDKLVKQADMPADIEKVLARGNAQSNDLDFFNSLLMDLSANAQITEGDIMLNYEGDIKERGPLNWSWVQAILKTLDKTPLGNWSIKKFTYDAYMYLSIPGIKRQINEFVMSMIGNEPCVVVGHSLGSAVAYNILRNCTTPNVKKYITVGSPLGLRSFKARLEVPIFMPKCISGGWFNGYDERDVVALQPLNKAHFDIDPAIENFNKINNQTDNRHGIEGYLNDPTVARKIYESLV